MHMSQHQYILISVKLDSSNKSSRFDGVYIPCRFCKTCLNLTKNNVYLSSALRSSAGPTEYSPPPFFFRVSLGPCQFDRFCQTSRNTIWLIKIYLYPKMGGMRCTGKIRSCSHIP
ncbi:SORF1 [Gallid alphaherpesvirus 2]|uniref:SORF1 n=1 Tax=Gallid alphaherpesvirus 2 TaxID=10390 RepID=A7KQB3_9ALPH|nr:SORF1 [Gallid alphaherpesvirus 2]QOJ42239.1 hypothetical protein [synthetic construct]AQN77722.1 SORF1 [Gallid alphaherpesvirus 2]ARE59156.1 SORF1 [Gallid alphaherpesvirus 2]QOJ42423.1 hypothetical protein [synthetic construct]